jgi:hypothetical protein
VTDIREKVVEEPYFGRVVTDGTAQVHVTAPEDEPAKENAAPPGGSASETRPASRETEVKNAGPEPGKE